MQLTKLFQNPYSPLFLIEYKTIIIPILRFRQAVKIDVVFIPSKGIKTNPAAKGPKKEPKELQEYNLPMSLPVFSNLTQILLTTGQVAPKRVAGIIITKNKSRN